MRPGTPEYEALARAVRRYVARRLAGKTEFVSELARDTRRAEQVTGRKMSAGEVAKWPDEQDEAEQAP